VSANSNFKDLLSALNACGARYLVVGGYAVMLYTEPRFTKDLDIWIEASPDNAARVYRALAGFGAPLSGIQVKDFTVADLIYQLGMPPSRVDILTSISGVDFEDAWKRRRVAEFGDIPTMFIGLGDLIANKRTTGRTTDLADCERLEEAADPGPSE
jgi:hypothetical protein